LPTTEAVVVGRKSHDVHTGQRYSSSAVDDPR
jgi:hypothetical protein